MSGTSWIRVSVDMAVDAKILELTYPARWAYIEVLIAAKRYYNGGRFESRKVLATCVEPNAMRHVDSLLKVGLLAQDDDGAILIPNWDKYQTDPTGKERQKRHREKVKAEKVNRDMYVIGSPENEAAIAAGILPANYGEITTKYQRTSDEVTTNPERIYNKSVGTSYETRNESSVKTPDVTVTSHQETKTKTETETKTNNLSLTLSLEDRLHNSTFYNALSDSEKADFKGRLLDVERKREETKARQERSLRPLSLQDIVKGVK
jgi:hypothetical protein